MGGKWESGYWVPGDSYYICKCSGLLIFAREMFAKTRFGEFREFEKDLPKLKRICFRQILQNNEICETYKNSVVWEMNNRYMHLCIEKTRRTRVYTE